MTISNSNSLLSILDKQLIDLEDFSSFLLQNYSIDVSSIIGHDDDIEIIENTILSYNLSITDITDAFITSSLFDNLDPKHKDILIQDGWTFGYYNDAYSTPFAEKGESKIFGEMTISFLSNEAENIISSLLSPSIEDKLSLIGYSLLSVHPLTLAHSKSGYITSGKCAQFLINNL